MRANARAVRRRPVDDLGNQKAMSAALSKSLKTRGAFHTVKEQITASFRGVNQRAATRAKKGNG